MADNLQQTVDTIEQDINPNGTPGSITPLIHQNILKEVLNKVGKYVGAPYMAQKNITGTYTAGQFSFNNHALNETGNLVFSFAKKTSDNLDIVDTLNLLSQGNLIYFKDFEGRSAQYRFVSKVENTTKNTYDVTVTAVDGNPNYTYQDNQIEIAVVSFMANVQSNTTPTWAQTLLAGNTAAVSAILEGRNIGLTVRDATPTSFALVQGAIISIENTSVRSALQAAGIVMKAVDDAFTINLQVSGTGTGIKTYNFSRDKQGVVVVESDLNDYLPLTGGTLTSQLKLALNNPTNELLILRAMDRFSDLIFSDTGGSLRLRNDQGVFRFFAGGDANDDAATNAVDRLAISSTNFISSNPITIQNNAPSIVFADSDNSNRTGSILLGAIQSNQNYTLPPIGGVFAMTSDITGWATVTGSRPNSDLSVLIGSPAGTGNSTNFIVNDTIRRVDVNALNGILVSGPVMINTSGGTQAGVARLLFSGAANRDFTFPSTRGGTVALLNDITDWATITGTRAGQDLVALIGSPQGTGLSTRIEVRDVDERVDLHAGNGLRITQGGLELRTGTGANTGYASQVFSSTTNRQYTWPANKSGTVAMTSDIPSYAEGTFTPTFSGTNYTVGSATGYYVRTGNIVKCHVEMTGISGTNNLLRVEGLPFTIAPQGNNVGSMFRFAGSNATRPEAIKCATASTGVVFARIDETVNLNNITFTSGAIVFDITYRTNVYTAP